MVIEKLIDKSLKMVGSFSLPVPPAVFQSASQRSFDWLSFLNSLLSSTRQTTHHRLIMPQISPTNQINQADKYLHETTRFARIAP